MENNLDITKLSEQEAKDLAGDQTRLKDLNEEQLEQLQTRLQTPPPAPADLPPPEPPKEQTEEEKKQAEEQARLQAEEEAKKKAEEEAKAKGEVIFAGKNYPNQEEFLKAVVEIAKPLKYNPKLLETLVEQAKKTGDFKPLEAVYAELETEMGTRSAEAERLKAEQARKAQETAETLPPESEEEKAKVEEFVLGQVYSHIESTPLAEALREKDLKVPKTAEEYEALYQQNPWLGQQFQQLFNRTYEHYIKVAQDQRKVEFQSGPHNERVTQDETQKILGLVKEHGLNFTPDQVAEFVKKTYEHPQSREKRMGIDYNVPNYAFREFLAENYTAVTQQIALNTANKSREQILEDIKKMGERTTQSISTAQQGSSGHGHQEKSKVDLKDRDAVVTLTDEQIDQGLADPESLNK